MQNESETRKPNKFIIPLVILAVIATISITYGIYSFLRHNIDMTTINTLEAQVAILNESMEPKQDISEYVEIQEWGIKINVTNFAYKDSVKIIKNERSAFIYINDYLVGTLHEYEITDGLYCTNEINPYQIVFVSDKYHYHFMTGGYTPAYDDPTSIQSQSAKFFKNPTIYSAI